MEALKAWRLTALAAGCLMAFGAAAADSAAVNQLVQQAQFWEQKQRPDLARDSWKRVLQTDPNHAEALNRLSVLEAAAGNATEARRYEDRLQKVAPGTAARRAQTDATARSGADQLATARSLARQNRPDDAVAAYRKTFSGPTPPDELALEYYETLAGTRDGWNEARRGLAQLNRARPSDTRVALAQARVLTYRAETRREGIDQLQELSTNPAAQAEARRAWRQALIWLAPTTADRPRYDGYLQQVGEDAAVRARLADTQQKPQPQQQPDTAAKSAAPAAPRVDTQTETELREAFAALDRNAVEEAETGFTRLLARKPADADAQAGLGVVRLRQGRFAESEQLLDRASRGKPALASRYREARQTAAFWGRVRTAEAAVEKNDYRAAEAAYESALSQAPNGRPEPAVVRAAADVLVHNGKNAQAERELRAALKNSPGNPDLVGGLAGLLQRDGRSREAQQLLGNVAAADQLKLQDVRVELARQQAATAIEAGRYADAERLLREAMVNAPASPWVRLDLARLYRKMGRDSDADSLLDSMVEAAGDGKPGGGATTEGWLAQSYAYAEGQRWYETLMSLENLPAANRTGAAQRLQREAWVRYQIQRAQQAARQGDPGRAAQWISAAVNASGDSPELAPAIAQGWAALGDPARALAVLRRSFAANPNPGAGDRIQYAALLLQLDQDAEFEAVSTELIRRGGMTPLQQRTLEDLVVGYRVKLADRAREQANLAEAYRQLRDVIARYPDETRVQLALGRLFSSAGEPEKAMAIAQAQIQRGGGVERVSDEVLYAAIDAALADQEPEQASRWIDAAFERNTDPAGAHRAAARLAQSRGRQADALSHYRAAEALKQQTQAGPPLLAMIDPATGGNRSLPAGVFEALEGEQPVGPLLPRALGPDPEPMPAGIVRQPEATPGSERQGGFLWDRGLDSPRAESQAAATASRQQPLSLRLARSVNAGSLPASAEFIPDYHPAGNSPTERLEAAVSGWAQGEFMSRNRRGEEGLSKLIDLEFGADWISPEWSIGRIGARFRPVFLDAGAVSGTNLLKFGTLALINGEIADQDQSETGLAFALAYSLGSFSADVGTTPLGFPVESLVGGMRWTPQFGKTTVAVDLSRRAVTDSLLSYAGTYDPLTGREWGGVMRSGARLDLSHDLGNYGLYVNGGFYTLGGLNVKENAQYEFGAGFYSRLYRSTRHTVTAGLNLTAFGYEENLRHYTLGHGGYFSPQFFGALTVPVSWTYNRGPLSIRADAALGSQTFREDGAPLFPGRQALQDELERLAAFEPERNLPLGYSGQDNSGLGYKLGGAAQYRITPRFAAGGSLSVDNARDYKEFQLLGYIRYHFSGFQPLPDQPQVPNLFGAPLP
ncbi:MAG TPA: cellulose synthase subunit BcsC-related outer membrane protein [Solimonas sp.]